MPRVAPSPTAAAMYRAHLARARGLPAPVETPITPKTGPGTELHAILVGFGFDILKGCRCRSRIDQMNRWGPDGCEANMTVIVAWLKEAFELAKIDAPFEPAVVELVIREAIRLAREEPPPPPPPTQPAPTPP